MIHANALKLIVVTVCALSSITAIAGGGGNSPEIWVTFPMLPVKPGQAKLVFQCMTPENASAQGATGLVSGWCPDVNSRQFRTAVVPNKENTYTLTADTPTHNLCVDIAADRRDPIAGDIVNLFTCNSSNEHQHWRTVRSTTKPGVTLRPWSVQNICLAIQENSQTPKGSNMKLAQCNDTDPRQLIRFSVMSH